MSSRSLRWFTPFFCVLALGLNGCKGDASSNSDGPDAGDSNVGTPTGSGGGDGTSGSSGGGDDASDGGVEDDGEAGNGGSGGNGGGEPGAAGEGGRGNGGGGSGSAGESTSGGGQGGSGSVVGPSPALGRVTLPDYSTADSPAFLDGVVGIYDVAIFRVPEGMEELIGKATLTVEHSGADGFKAELVAENGTTVSHVDSTEEGNLNAMLTPIIGQVFVFRDPSIEGYLNISFSAEGYIYGAAGGAAELAFRNDIVAYGAGVPEVFADRAGVYHGPQLALTCEQPPVTLTIEADGTATLEGSYNLSCEEGTVSATWDGNDDFMVPLAVGYELWIDSRKGGGSGEGGGVRIQVSGLEADATVLDASTTGNGLVGNIESGSLVREGDDPTQAQFTVQMIRGLMLDVALSGLEEPPWDMDTTTLEIAEDDTVLFAGQLFTFQLATNVEGTTDQKTFRFQTIYETFYVIFVELDFKTDGTFVGGRIGGTDEGAGTLAPAE